VQLRISPTPSRPAGRCSFERDLLYQLSSSSSPCRTRRVILLLLVRKFDILHICSRDGQDTSIGLSYDRVQCPPCARTGFPVLPVDVTFRFDKLSIKRRDRSHCTKIVLVVCARARVTIPVSQTVCVCGDRWNYTITINGTIRCHRMKIAYGPRET
jgi:hypothetical protein